MFESLNQSQLKGLTAIHGWSGVVLGLLLYLVTITGAVVVFAEEIAIWSKGGQSPEAGISEGIDGQVRPLMDYITKGYRENVTISSAYNGDTLLFASGRMTNPESGQPEAFGTLFVLDPLTGDLKHRAEGFASELVDLFARSALQEFLVDLHVQLYVPSPWGLILTGILGLGIMGAGVTGLFMHRHMIRDLFVAERPGERLVSFRDRHVLASAWSLLFAFLLGLTGAFFSFALTIGAPIMAMIAFGGDQDLMFETLLDQPAAIDERPAPSADLDRIIADAVGRAGAPVDVISIRHYGRADSEILVSHGTADGVLFGPTLIYAGPDGAFVREKPEIGREPSFGNSFLHLMPLLHFGTFAGLLSKTAWAALGAAMCFVIISGIRLWTRRREEDPAWRAFERLVSTVAWGTPIAMLMSAYGYFMSAPFGEAFYWTPASFFISAAACMVLGALIQDDAKLRSLLTLVCGAACLALPIVRLAFGGTAWSEALAAGLTSLVSVDLFFVFCGLGLIWWWRRSLQTEAAVAPAAAE